MEKFASATKFLLGAVFLFAFTPVRSETKTMLPVTVPIEIRHDNVFVMARVNGSEPLTFKLDTGFGITTVHPQLTESLHLKKERGLTISGIAGNEEADTYSGASFDFSGAIYSPRRVAVIPSEGERRGRRRDGILGASFFRQFVVELNPKNKTMTLREPTQFSYEGKGEIIPLEFPQDTPVVEATVRFTNHPDITARFEIDSGCDSSLCLANDFVETNHLSAATGQQSSRIGIGGTTKILEVELVQFRLGKTTLDKIPANLFLEGSSVGGGFAGHIGMGVLGRYNVIFDYTRKRMILESPSIEPQKKTSTPGPARKFTVDR